MESRWGHIMLIFNFYDLRQMRPIITMSNCHHRIATYLGGEVLNVLSADYLKKQIKTALSQVAEGLAHEPFFCGDFTNLDVFDSETLIFTPGGYADPDEDFEYKVKASDFLIALEIWTNFLKLGGFEEGLELFSFFRENPVPPRADRLAFGGVKEAIREYLAFVRSSTNPLLLKMSDEEALTYAFSAPRGVWEEGNITLKILPTLSPLKLKEYQEQFWANKEARETLLEWLDQGPQGATVLSVDQVKFERQINGYLTVTDDAYPTDHMFACTPQEFREAIEHINNVCIQE